MQDENREKLTEEPREVVQWYVRPEGREVVDYLSLIHISEPTRPY